MAFNLDPRDQKKAVMQRPGTMALRGQTWIKCYFLGLFKEAAEDSSSWSLANEGEFGRRRGQQDSHGSGITEATESVWILL